MIARAAATTALVVACVAMGCGSDPRADYLGQADDVCREGGSRIAGLSGEPERALDALVDVQRRLEALRPPADLRRDVDAYLDASRRQIELLRRIAAAPEEEAERVASEPASRRLVQRRRALAERIGFDACS